MSAMGRHAVAGAVAVLLAAALAAAPAPAGSPHSGVGPHLDVVAPPDTVVPDRVVTPTAETDPVGGAADAADDMAFWRNPSDPAQSTVIGTDKVGALEVYDLSGHRLQVIAPGSQPGNVDLRPGFPLGGGAVDIVGVTGHGMRFYAVDPASRLLTDVTAPELKVDLPVAGTCMYTSPVSGKFFILGDTRDGRAEQWELFDSGGKVDVRSVRGPWQVSDNHHEVEGCVFDDETQSLYLADEDVGIWRYGAEPSAPTTERTMVDGVANHRLVNDIEGLAIVKHGPPGAGYLIASSQGDDAFVVYRRQAPHDWVGKFTLADGSAADRCTKTDGIEAVGGDFGPLFPLGIFSCQDHTNTPPGTSGNQNFKLVRLEEILDLS